MIAASLSLSICVWWFPTKTWPFRWLFRDDTILIFEDKCDFFSSFKLWRKRRFPKRREGKFSEINKKYVYVFLKCNLVIAACLKTFFARLEESQIVRWDEILSQVFFLQFSLDSCCPIFVLVSFRSPERRMCFFSYFARGQVLSLSARFSDRSSNWEKKKSQEKIFYF